MLRTRKFSIVDLVRSSCVGSTLLTLTLFFPSAHAARDHSGFISGTFESGPAVTARCLQCHPAAATEVMSTIHWTWKRTSNGQDLGKSKVINNYCIALPSNEPRCTSCHIGYGWSDASFDFSVSANIDCLVCHDGTGTYKKTPTGAGIPDPTVDLLTVARSVGYTPTRVACGNCHFYGGGGDAVKHGTMDSSLANPSRDVDVHMSTDGLGFQCVNCHQADSHKMPGTRYSKSTPDNVSCEECHTAAPHTQDRLNTHAARVACQTCHIPAMARGNKATKMWWDWTSAGEKNPDGSDKILKDNDGNEVYNTKKGSFVWERNVVPDYVWVNGGVTYTTLEDTVAEDEIVTINQLHGDRSDPNSRIMPVKRFRGIQPYDAGTHTLAVPHLFPYNSTDTTALWKTYDWTAALTEGQSAVGKTFVGPVGWIETEMFWIQNHMVAPKEQALHCSDCHTSRGRLDFPALGYSTEESLSLGTMFGFAIEAIDVTASAGQIQLRWIGTPGHIYQVQAAPNADFSTWQDVTDGTRTVDAGSTSEELIWSESTQDNARLYRIVRAATP